MNSVIIPFSEELHLGRAVNVTTMTVGPYIGHQEGNTMLTDVDKGSFDSTIVRNRQSVRNGLKIGAALSVSLNFGMKVLGGFESRYQKLFSSIRKRSSAAVIINRETVVESLKPQSSSWLVPEWKSVSENMTHYVSSVTYGGYLDIICKMSESSDHTDEEISQMLSTALPMLGFAMEAGFDSVHSESTSDEKLHISLSGTSMKMSRHPNSIAEVGQFVDNFLENVRSGNEGKGSPLTCTLLPLSLLDASFKTDYTKMGPVLEKVNDMLDDISDAAELIKSKVDNPFFVKHLSSSKSEEIRSWQRSLEEIKGTFRNALSDANPESLEQKYNNIKDTNSLGGFHQQTQSLFASFAQESIPAAVLNYVKEMSGYASWHTANTKVGYHGDAKDDIKTADGYYLKIRSSDVFSETFCSLLRDMAWAAAWHAACEMFGPKKEAKKNKKKFDECRTKLLALLEVKEEVINKLQQLFWSSAWFTAHTRSKDQDEARKCNAEIKALIRELSK